MSKKNETCVSIDYEFFNKYTNKEESYTYWLTIDQAGKVVKDYLGSYQDVELDCRDSDAYLLVNHILYLDNDAESTDYIIERMCDYLRKNYSGGGFENNFHFKEFAQEEFEEYIEDNNSVGYYDDEDEESEDSEE